MKRSSIIEQRRKSVNPETRRAVDFSFLIVDRIHEILERKGLRQKDLAMRLGKKEPEIGSVGVALVIIAVKHSACHSFTISAKGETARFFRVPYSVGLKRMC